MTLTSSHTLWPDLMADLNDPGLLVQVFVIVFCMAAGWVLSRLLASMFSPKGERTEVLQARMDSFLHVLSPLLSVFLIALSIPVLGRWQHVGLIRVALPLLTSYLLIRVVFFLLRRIFTQSGNAGSILWGFEKIFSLIVWACVALYITGLWPEITQFLEQTTLPIGRHQESLMVIMQAALSVAVTLMLALWAAATLEQRLMKLESVHSSLRAVLARTGRAVLILVAVLVSLSLVGLDLTVLSVFGGALGVGIGLGLQKLVSSYVSGFVVLLERSLSVGDLVTVDKFSGRVEQINTRYTILRGTDGTESVIPNEMLVSSPVQNFSLTDSKLRLSTTITVSYASDIDWLFPQLEQAVAILPGVLSEPMPVALLLRFGVDGLDLEVSFWVNDLEKKFSPILSDVNRAIWRLLLELKVDIPYLQREMRIAEETKNLLLNKHLADSAEGK
jgi:small-conductance mechanosensitive channel